MLNYKEFALNNAQQESSAVAVVSCSKTEIELFYTAGTERVYLFESFGFCRECQEPFHISALHGLTSSSEWPVQYEGKLCEDCYQKADEEVELSEEEKKILDSAESEEG